MGWKTKTVMVPKEVKYFVMEIDEICDKIQEFHYNEKRYPSVIIIHEDSGYDIKKELSDKFTGYDNGDKGDITSIQIYGIKIRTSKDTERDAIEIY